MHPYHCIHMFVLFPYSFPLFCVFSVFILFLFCFFLLPVPILISFFPSYRTYGDLECVNYCFPTNLIPEVAVSGAEYCGRVFRDIGVNPIATWVLNNTRSNDTADYLTFFVTAESIINNFNTLGFTDLTIASFCVDAALTLLCRYVYPTCDPAFRVPTYDPICRRGCYTLEDFLCKDFFIGLRIAIAGNLLDVSTIDPPLCDPLEDTEGGGAPMCINTLDGGELSFSTSSSSTGPVVYVNACHSTLHSFLTTVCKSKRSTL